MKVFRQIRRKRVWVPLSLAALWAIGWYALPFAVPLPEDLMNPPPASPVVLDRRGEPIRRLTLSDFSRSEPVTLADLPPDFIACTFAAEDKRFRSHGGVDLLATARAFKDLVMKRHVVSGASTITQQLVKISSPPTHRGLSAKLYEALAARRLEMTWSKDRILTEYLNRLDYGNRRRGPSEASRYLFQKPLSDLSLGECALLAGLPQAPTRLNPIKRRDASLARRDVVLERLAVIDPDQTKRVQAAQRESLNLRPLSEKQAAPWLAPAFTADVRSSLDLALQRDVEAIVHEELNTLRGNNLHHAAVVVIHNPTGEILALVSSGNWNDPRGGQINGALAPRSPGSALKPFTYLLAFEKAGRYPGSIVADVPTRFRTLEGLNLPENFDRTHRGPVSIRTALACSLNVPAMRELNNLGGPEPLHHLLTDLGLTTLGDQPAHYGLGLTIGNAPVKLIELTNAYAILARGGVFFPPVLFPTTANAVEKRQIFSARDAWLVADILSDPDARAPSFGRRGPLELPFRCAVKTGTSSDFHDNWCLGFTRDFTVGVWAGNFDQTPIKGLSGVAGAGPIFHRTMVRAQRDSAPAWLDRPEGINTLSIDVRTGRALPATMTRVSPFSEVCASDRLPPPASADDYDQEGHVLLDASYSEWFNSPDNRRQNDFALAKERPSPEVLRILAPLDGITCLLDPELPSGGKKLRVASNLPGTTLWSSPTLTIEPGSPEPSVVLQPGTHTLVATDPRDGSRRTVTIHVEKL